MKYAALALIACLSLFNQSVHAAAAPQAEPEFILPAGVSPDDPEAAELAMQYFTLGPSFVTNYDGSGRLKYLKADISVLARLTAQPYLERHLPYIRNRLVVLFSGQLEETLQSTQGKEALRQQALVEIRHALQMLETPSVADQILELYFTSYVLQR
ncbi:MAG: flagellar basal body-associated FliL family protein [Pseudomonadota bacterium]|nr:flagellar basal body rod protein [Gammaproteobacteria bacterium]MBJ56088.1 flagellar basal body rod protein [Gammaproteobacteria bacterium]MEC8860463.1 flagellar basal body-associated FliL family protein [Pseudomonadota bacterium]HBN15314.1 flagellar basal body rod protein [Pseudohongiella sp.]|tara:strand:- start:241 stop:708 length:468 start_codon:yes stop_codon:yes gene_type:complete